VSPNSLAAIYTKVDSIAAVVDSLRDGNYDSSVDVSEQAGNLEQVAALAAEAAKLYRGIEKVLGA
jgi:hypothetical protein